MGITSFIPNRVIFGVANTRRIVAVRYGFVKHIFAYFATEGNGCEVSHFRFRQSDCNAYGIADRRSGINGNHRTVVDR